MVVGGKITLAGVRTTLLAANQGCRPGNKVVSPQISLSAFPQACAVSRQAYPAAGTLEAFTNDRHFEQAGFKGLLPIL
jgi:hypothetical protein